jgi:hypothetical protein
MEGFILFGVLILAFIGWLLISKDKEKMNNMLLQHEVLPYSPAHSREPTTKPTDYEKKLAELKREWEISSDEAHSSWQQFNDATNEDYEIANRAFSNREITIEEFRKRSDEYHNTRDLAEAECNKKSKLSDEKYNEYMKCLTDYHSSLVSSSAATKISSIGQSSVIEKAQVDFDTFDKYFSQRGDSGIAIDRTNKQIALLTPNSRVIVQYADIVSSEVVVDSESIVKTDRVGQVGGAVVGGLLTGGIGALVMAMGASKKQLDKVNKIELKVLTMGTHNPIHSVIFYKKNTWGAPKSALEDANKWYDFISVAIKESEVASHNNATRNNSALPTSSLVDELHKLSELRSEGLLTDDEFSNAKKILMS